MSGFLLRLGKKFQQSFQNAHYVLGEPFEEKQLFWKKLYSKSLFGLWGECFQPRFENHFRHSQKKLFTKNMSFRKKLCHFRVNAEVISKNLVATLLQDGQNCLSVVQRSMFLEKNCFWKKLFFSNWDLEDIFVKVLQNIFDRLLKIAV